MKDMKEEKRCKLFLDFQGGEADRVWKKLVIERERMKMEIGEDEGM